MSYRERGLLGRLRTMEGFVGRTAQPDLRDANDSIQRHLTELLNTRHGESPAFPDYGLPALSDVGVEESCEEVRRAIEQAIRKYEPRLTAVRVVYIKPDDGDPLRLRFQIQGRAVGFAGQQLSYDTSVDSIAKCGGMWRVSE